MPKPIYYLNASALSRSGCDLRTYFSVVEGLQPDGLPSVETEYGSAFHAFVAEMKRTGGNIALGLTAARNRFNVPMNVGTQKRYMNETHLLLTCQQWWNNVGEKDDFITLATDELGPMVEVKFAYPYYESDAFDIMLAGTIDDVCVNHYKTYGIRDYKTTASQDVKEYLYGYRLSPQLMFYRLLVRYYAKKYPDSIWEEMNHNDCCVFIDGVFLRGAAKPVEFQRGDVEPISKEKLDEFEMLLKAKIDEFIAMVKQGRRPARVGMLNGSCRIGHIVCPYFNVCAASDDIARNHVINNSFKQIPYNPLDR